MWFILRSFVVIFETVAGWIFWLVNRNRPKGNLPPVDDPIVLESALSLAAKIRKRQVSS
jgi:hypothetical protein